MSQKRKLSEQLDAVLKAPIEPGSYVEPGKAMDRMVAEQLAKPAQTSTAPSTLSSDTPRRSGTGR